MSKHQNTLSAGRNLPEQCGVSTVAHTVVTGACVVTTATHTDRLVMSGHTNVIESLANNSADNLIGKSDLLAV